MTPAAAAGDGCRGPADDFVSRSDESAATSCCSVASDAGSGTGADSAACEGSELPNADGGGRRGPPADVSARCFGWSVCSVLALTEPASVFRESRMSEIVAAERGRELMLPRAACVSNSAGRDCEQSRHSSYSLREV